MIVRTLAAAGAFSPGRMASVRMGSSPRSLGRPIDVGGPLLSQGRYGSAPWNLGIATIFLYAPNAPAGTVRSQFG
jgi:hypothetical protein